nr:endonuclease III [Vampirovibrio sp.]
NIPIGKILKTLSDTYKFHPMDELTQEDPYKVLIACIMSLRTKDETTMPAAERLFAEADVPQAMVKLTPEKIQELIYPVGFFRNKSQTILTISQDILDRFAGQVPNTIDELLTLKGVGRKTANLVVGLGFRLPAICVDVHVHRICQRLGYLETKTPEETEMALREKLPQQYWHIINKVMVLHGQQICKPIGARCDACPVAEDCQKVDVKSRKIPAKAVK